MHESAFQKNNITSVQMKLKIFQNINPLNFILLPVSQFFHLNYKYFKIQNI